MIENPNFSMDHVDSKWEVLQARVTPEEKQAVCNHCRNVIKLPYSVTTRLFWRRIISNYQQMPKDGHNDVMLDIQNATDDLMVYLPTIIRQRQRQPRNY